MVVFIRYITLFQGSFVQIEACILRLRSNYFIIGTAASCRLSLQQVLRAQILIIAPCSLHTKICHIS